MKRHTCLEPFSTILLTVQGIFMILLTTATTAAQNNKATNKFDSIYFETAVHISATDINRAIAIADSLHTHSESELHQLKALMLSSTLFQQKGEMKKSIHYATMADQLAVKNNFYDWEARIAGFLSTQYRILGLYEQGEVYLEKGKNVSKLIENEEIKILYLGLIFQETAYYAMEYGNYQRAHKAVKTAEGYFMRLTDEVNKNYFLATNEELLGRTCIGLKEWDEALQHYNEAIKRMGKITQQDAMLNGFVHSGLGRVYFEKNEPLLAIDHLKKSEQIVQLSDHLELKIEVYKTLSEYYKSEDDYKNYSVYHDKYIDAFQANEKKKKQSIDNFVNTIQQRDKSLSFNYRILIIVAIFLVLIIIATILWHRRSKQRDFERFKLIMRKLKEQNRGGNTTEIESGEPVLKDKKRLISEAVESKLLSDLDEFEKTGRYTDNQISLPMLAGILNTNTKYLSYVLKTHKNKDFNAYINELRIRYIIEKIEKNDVFKNYKISYLAEEAGFSSHSKFSAIFKSVTGFSPSTFLDYLEKSTSLSKQS
ncbi:helix-turn-helix domain-containing protein [Fluviicola sp. SGL-29]|nr:helix-turn-helix domain-containing protein [Fluviicola sp. SGL-29]